MIDSESNSEFELFESTTSFPTRRRSNIQWASHRPSRRILSAICLDLKSPSNHRIKWRDPNPVGRRIFHDGTCALVVDDERRITAAVIRLPDANRTSRMPVLRTDNDPDLDDFDTISDLSSVVTEASSLPTPPPQHARLLTLRTSSTLSSLAEKRKAVLRRSVSALESFPKEVSPSFRHKCVRA
jgi:hypothetical protein